jgi:hypothetical protein
MGQYTPRYEFIDVKEVGVDGATASQYSLHIEIVEVVDSDGQAWDPEPGPDPWDELVKVEASKITTSAPLPVGTTINGVTGTFTGGDPENTTYRYRWRTRPVGGSWTNESWNTGWTNEARPVTYDLPADKFNYQIQLQTQARDDVQDPAIQILNNSPTKNTEKSTIGDVSVTINDIAYDLVNQAPLTILMNDPIVVVVSISGNAQNVTYNWAARSDYPLMVGSQSASTILTFPQEGGPTVTCTISDPASQEQAISIGMNFYVVDAFD